MKNDLKKNFHPCILQEINLEPESVLPTLYAAKKYMVNPLANECINYLEKNLKPENVCVILMQVERG